MNINHNKEFFNVYKVFRNHLRPLDLTESLYVVWAYILNLEENKKFPVSINVDPQFLSADKIQKSRIISLWDLEIIAGELILHSDQNPYPTKTLKNWNYLIGTSNKLKDIEGFIAQTYVNKSNVMRELQRIAHRQFPSQADVPTCRNLSRYYRIFSDDQLNKIIERTIGLSTKELYFVGLLIWGFFRDKFLLFQPFKSEVDELPEEKINLLLNFLSTDIPSLKTEIRQSQQLNEKFFYSFNPLKKKPIIKTTYKGNSSLICPVPNLIYNQFTGGIYYSIFRDKDFSQVFGDSFELYVGEVIRKAITRDDFKIYEAEKYGAKSFKESTDWIIDQSNAAIFIECKTKRMTVDAKSELLSNEKRGEQISIISDAIIQLYKNINLYKADEYPNYPFAEGKKIYPLVLTFEEWFVFGDEFLGEIGESVRIKANHEGINLSLISESPYTICSINDFEYMAQILQEVGVEDFMSRKINDEEMKKWQMFSYIHKVYFNQLSKVKDLFPNTLNEILPERFKQ